MEIINKCSATKNTKTETNDSGSYKDFLGITDDTYFTFNTLIYRVKLKGTVN
jgi:hypothetical protein